MRIVVKGLFFFFWVTARRSLVTVFTTNVTDRDVQTVVLFYSFRLSSTDRTTVMRTVWSFLYIALSPG